MIIIVAECMIQVTEFTLIHVKDNANWHCVPTKTDFVDTRAQMSRKANWKISILRNSLSCRLLRRLRLKAELINQQ
jgi:hypothetical protein